MDASSFGTFLRDLLINEAKKYEGNLLSVNYENIAEAKRMGGIRDTLIGISQSIDPALKDFYAKKGNTLPAEDAQ